MAGPLGGCGESNPTCAALMTSPVAGIPRRCEIEPKSSYRLALKKSLGTVGDTNDAQSEHLCTLPDLSP